MYSFRYNIKPITNGYIPVFWASALRGAFGHALKRIVCINKLKQCDECYLLNTCTFTKIFNPKPDSNITLGRKFSNLPTPFIIKINSYGGEITIDRVLSFELNIFDNNYQYTPFVILAMKKALFHGIGKQNIQFEIESIIDDNGGNIFDINGNKLIDNDIDIFNLTIPDKFNISLETPLRLIHNSKLLGENEWRASVFIFASIKRYAMLRSIYCGIETDNVGRLKQICSDIGAENINIKWKDLSRYSTRQKEKLKIGGLIGDFTLDLSDYPYLKPFIAALPYMGLGKGTSMGLGSISISNFAK